MELYLYHYFEKEIGPFRNLSFLRMEDADLIMKKIKQEGNVFASKRSDDYLSIRRELEFTARDLFLKKGGRPKTDHPHYLTLGPCEWLMSWYNQGSEVKIPLKKFDPNIISFSYGDLFPTMRYKDGKTYRGQIYTKSEIFSVIDEYGFPQEWNKEGTKGPERYIEVQVWDNEFYKDIVCID